MSNSFADDQKNLISPADEFIEITPTNGSDISPKPRAIYVLTSGDLAIRDKNNLVVVHPVVAGQTLDFRARGIEATNTTATAVGWR